ncbi:MAG: hypothetical protein HQL37_01740 [Alphaproteobacteria bacterium]|nr:hypothetical protein [Alphaproteobacteria bacterium]
MAFNPMPGVNVEIANGMAIVAAVKWMDQVLTAARDEAGGLLAGMVFDRQGNVFVGAGTIRNAKVSGRITVLDCLIKVQVTLPIVAVAYRGAAEKSIREYLESRLI